MHVITTIQAKKMFALHQNRSIPCDLIVSVIKKTPTNTHRRLVLNSIGPSEDTVFTVN